MIIVSDSWTKSTDRTGLATFTQCNEYFRFFRPSALVKVCNPVSPDWYNNASLGSLFLWSRLLQLNEKKQKRVVVAYVLYVCVRDLSKTKKGKPVWVKRVRMCV